MLITCIHTIAKILLIMLTICIYRTVLLEIMHQILLEVLPAMFHTNLPVRIRVRIDTPHPLVCRKRRLDGAVLRMRPEKLRSRVSAGVVR
jgi:hypothetical protein